MHVPLLDTVERVLSISVSKLEKYSFDRQTIRWINNWLVGHVQRVTVNGSMPKWRTVTSSDPQKITLGLTDFNMFINNIENRIECTHSKIVDDTKANPF